MKVPIFITTAHFYLDDLYEELGPTKFIPGSHQGGTRGPDGDVEWQGVGDHSIMCNAGDVVMFPKRGVGTVARQIRAIRTAIYCRCITPKRMITQKFPPYLNKFQFDEAILCTGNAATTTVAW